MALTLASSRSSAVRGAVRSQQRVPRRTLVIRAGFLSGIASAFTTIFSPPQHTNVPWDGTGSSFSGRISHKAGKPFSDGFGASGGERRAMDGSEQQDANMDDAAASGAAEEDVTDYVSGAVKRVIGHNFTVDATEPEWGGVGWNDEIHKNKDEFHTGKRH